MSIKLLSIILFSYGYLIFELAIGLWQRKKLKVSESGDRKSLWLLLILITIGFYLAFHTAMYKAGRIYHWNITFAVGAFLAATGLVIRTVSIRLLKRYFTYTVTRVEGHQIIEKGFYRYIRHPGYLGQILIFLGISVSLSNWFSIGCMMLPVGAGFLNRIRVEERFMAEQFGVEYQGYCRRTKKLIPKVY
jgi:protein-S-isoprenylcysteine O-methyltransferase Ste14